MADQAFYIGMDLGGTTFKALAVTQEGRILGRTQGDTGARATPESVRLKMVRAIERLQRDVSASAYRLQGIGFGIPGILDLPAGVVRQSPNLPTWHNVDVRALFGHYLPTPFTIDNDANAALQGEAWLGAGQGTTHLVMLTLGTGVGGAILIDGHPLHGAYGYAGELGHTVVNPYGPPCLCGSRGCLEQYASGTAIAKMAEPYHGKMTARQVAAAARHGDVHALDVFRIAGHYLGIACANFAHVLNPQRLIIGGGVAQAFDLFGDALRATLRQHTMAATHQNLQIVPATCGADAGALGAAYQAMHLLNP